MLLSRPCLACLETAMRGLQLRGAQPRLLSASQSQSRQASHKTEGRANGAKDGAGKRLGCKKTQGEYVIPGNIIFKQRGTKWFPGDNCNLGRDHTIHAAAPGYVRFYRDPSRHPDKKYIGVVLRPDDKLPRPRNAPIRRLLGMTAVKMSEPPVEDGHDIAETSDELPPIQSLASMRPGYQYRIANWEIGRAAERKGISVKPYDPKDRFAAWRKRTARRAKAAEMRGMRKQKKR